MSFTDPQSVTISGVTTPLPRVSSGPSIGAFQSADGLIRMDVSHNYGRRTSRMLKLTQQKTSADPLLPSTNVVNTQSFWVVSNTPVQGFTVTEQKALADALIAYLTASTGARVAQLLGGEN